MKHDYLGTSAIAGILHERSRRTRFTDSWTVSSPTGVIKQLLNDAPLAGRSVSADLGMASDSIKIFFAGKV
ncbi:MAG: hypothetical protein M9923_10225 [Phycicoccus sp.]|uniref:hypothetical protein n=1 Tax=Phycicoccus sp. TaxID=1902410 RepID=UPI002589E731|nr:hypothetical protein [Phycicoccus sp.]MCO5303573.1 hypothetical protein [Phycicoccus sp.]